MNSKAMKLFDAAVGRIAVSCLSRPDINSTAPSMNSLLMIRPGGIGDAVLVAPAILSLKRIYPAIHITILAEQRNAGVFALIPGVERLLCYDRSVELFQAMRGRYDVVIDSEQSHYLSAIVARFIPAPIKIGFATNERWRMFTHSIAYSHDDYEAVSFARLLEPLGIDAGMLDSRAPFLSIPEPSSRKAVSICKALQEQPFVTIFPGASIPERRWGAERYLRVAELLSTSGIKVVIVGGKGDLGQGEIIAGGGLGLNLAGLTSLAETAAIIQKSTLLLSGDSGVLHVAVGLGVPTVALFGPGRAKKWAPQGAQHRVINRELPCSPCTTFGTTPPCPINVQCMRDISVDEVFNAISLQLNRLGTVSFHDCTHDGSKKHE